MRYVFFGDSNARGLEIEDHIMLKTDFESVNAMKAQLLEQHDLKTAIVKWHIYVANQVNIPPHKYINRRVDNSYPYLLADKHNVEAVVHTHTASSMDYVLLQLQSMHSENKINPDTDTLFVGMCRPTRTFTLDRANGKYDFRFENTSGVDATDTSVAYKLKRMDLGTTELLSEFLTDNKLVATYYSALNSIIDLATANNYKLYLVPHFEQDYIKVDGVNRPHIQDTYKTHCQTDPAWYLHQFCVNTYEKASQYMFDQHLTHFQRNRPPCGFFHPDMQAHQQFAEYLAKNIDKASFN